MNSRRRILIVGISVFVLSLLFPLNHLVRHFWTSRNVIQVSAQELFRRYLYNPKEANSQFLYKELVVNGILMRIEMMSNGKSFLVLQSGSMLGEVSCALEQEAIHDKKVSLFSEVAIKGKCIGFITDVYLDHCSLINV